MIRIVRWMVWLSISLIIVAGLDQTLIRVPIKIPVLSQFQEFYVDFRSRVLRLGREQVQPSSIEQVLEKTDKKGAVADKTVAPRFLYVDDDGILQFADSLDAVPRAYRKDAQPMEQ